MDSKGKGKLSRWLKRLFVFGLTCLVGALLGIYLARIQVAHYFADKAIAQTDIVESRFQWDRLDTDASTLSDVFIRSDSYTLAVEQIDLSYDITEVWKEKKLKTLKLKGLQLYYDLTGPSTVDIQEVDALIKSGIPFPLGSVTTENATIMLLTDFGETSINLDLDLRQETSGIQGEVKAKTETESVDLEIAISDRIRGSVQANIIDLANTLSANGIEWNDSLPFTRKDALELSDASIDAEFVFNGITLDSASISANLGPLSFRDFDLEADVESAQASFELVGNEVINAESSIHLKRLSMESLIVSETTIQVSSPKQNEILVTIPDTHWESTNGERGVFSVRAIPVLKENYEIDTYSGDFRIKELQSDSFNMSPFEVAFSGTLESVEVTFGDLVNQAMPWLTVEDLGTTIKGLDTEAPEINVNAQLVASEWQFPDQTVSLSGVWKLDATLYPGSNPQRARLTLVPRDNTPIVSSAFATLDGTASLQADIEYWSEKREVALKLGATVADLTTTIEDWALQGGAASFTLATQPIDLIQLGDLRNNAPALIEFAIPLMDYEINMQGSELKGPSDLTIQWFSAGIHSLDPSAKNPIQTHLEFGAGIVKLGTEVVNQFFLNSELAGSYKFLDTKTNASFLFENEPVSIILEQTLDSVSHASVSKGNFEIEGINLISSDLLSRHLPELKDSSVSAKIELSGKTQMIDNDWDASMKIQMRDGSLRLPSKELSVDSIQADVNFSSLVSLSTDPSQTITADRIKIGDIEATQMRSEFRITNGSQLSVEKAGLSIFDGRVALDPFDLSIEDPNADLLIHFNRLSIAPAIAMLDFFDGNVSGRLNGTLPIAIENGYPVLGEGFLELDPTESARFSYNASGFFTDQGSDTLATKTLGDKLLERLGLEPNALLEDALGNLTIQMLRLDLFNKNLPSTPMRIQLAGTADTGQAQIPLNITTNVNGTVAELINFLTRLDSLGLVAGQEPVQSDNSDSNNL